MMFALLFLCGVAIAQDICSGLTQNEQPPSGRPLLKEAQKILYINVLPGYDADMKVGFNLLVQTLNQYYPGSTAEFWAQGPSNAAVGSLDQYTQIWVADLAYGTDNSPTQMSTYAAVANWYKGKGQPHIICDGRWISELWHPDGKYRPSQKLVENYFVALATRGGGLLLATDHAEDFTRGINEINKGIGIGPFHGYYATPPLLLEVDILNPIMTYPNDPTHHNAGNKYYIYDDSSTSFTPYNIQPNGKILYPVGWHGAKGTDNPGLSSTIRGGLGFLVAITSPTCASRVNVGTEVTFTAAVTKGGEAPITWSWSSSQEGPIGGKESTFKWIPTLGQHVIKVQATDNQRLVAEATVSFRVVYNSQGENGGLGPNGDGTCYIFMQPGQEIVEIFPIARTDPVLNYYAYSGGDAHVQDIPITQDKAANFFLYHDGKTLSMTALMSKLTLTGSIKLDVTGRNTGKATSLVLKDDALDNIVWNPATNVGSAQWSWKGTTKGFVISNLPYSKGINNTWCIDVAISGLSNIQYLTEYSQALPTKGVFPNPSHVIASNWYILSVPKFSYCRTTCYGTSAVTLTGLQGSFGPVRVDWTANTGGLTYNDGASTVWTVKPNTTGQSGVGVHFIGNFDVSTGDNLKVFNGIDTSSVPLLSLTNGGQVAPASIKVTNPNTVVSWTPNGDKKVGAGFTVWYVVIPTPLGLTPINGPESSHNWVTITGSNFVNTGQNVVKFGNVVLSGDNIKFDSPTSIRVYVPPTNKPMTVDVDVSNDGVFFQRVPQKYTFFAGTCKDVKVCGDCFNLAGCTWCNNIADETKSFCYKSNNTGTDPTCPKDATHNTFNTCSDAPDIEMTVREGETVQIQLIRPKLIGKVTQLKVSGAYKGKFINITNGVVTTNAKGEATFTAYLYLDGLTNKDAFTYQITGQGINGTGKVTITVTPFTRDYLLALWNKNRADECKDGTHNCQQLCLDGTPIPGYICGCKPGYNLTRNRFCEDIDECAQPNNGCLYGCINLPGSFTCKCQVGSAKDSAGKCQPLPCPISNWTETPRDPALAVSSLSADLPTFVTAMNAANPTLAWTAVPGNECTACDVTTIRTRTINHTDAAWNGSPLCAADAVALKDEKHCGYPCSSVTLYNGLQAVSYSVEQLTRREWLDGAVRAAMGQNTSLFTELPIDANGEAWAMNYFRVIFASCTDDSIEKIAHIVYGVMSDMLPLFAKNGRITVSREPVKKYPCALRVTIDDLIPSIEDCSDIADNSTNTNDFGEGWTSGEIAAVTIGGVVATAIVGLGAAAVMAPGATAPAEAASYVAL